MAPELSFSVAGAAAVPHCAQPTLALRAVARSAGAVPVQGVALDCQVRIEAQRRAYDGDERPRLLELFGRPEDWSRTLRSLLWTHAHASIAPFDAEAEFDLLLPCTFDFNVVVTKYLAALERETRIPLLLLFSGSVFYEDQTGLLQVSRIAWTEEAQYALPTSVWQDVIDHYYPDTAWLCLRRDVFQKLAAFKASQTLPTWEAALESLLARVGERAPR